MIRMIQSSSENHAKKYFSDALQKSDYYLNNTNDQELQGQFLGRLSQRMEISGAATKDKFFALCENINPATGKALTPRTREDRTIGYDINFHCPKSVSVIHALSKDNHILEVFQSSVNEVMREIEADSMTRVRQNGVYDDRKTGELIWAEFTHQTARPVDGSTPDPHLHSHCFVFNATWDQQEQRIKAGQFKDIKRDMPFYQSRYHKILADKLTDIGYQIRRTDKSFEIEGVPKSVIEMFSKRTNEIGEFAKEHGITNAAQLGELGARTRSKKQKGYTMDELKQDWRKQIQENMIYEDGEENSSIRYAPKKLQVQLTPKECVDFALDHTFERASVMDNRRILAVAYRQSIGRRSVSLDDITKDFEANEELIHIQEKNRTLSTTKLVLGEEQKMVAMARKGQGKFEPLFSKLPKIRLKDQQAEAVGHILTTKHQVSIIRGGAGTGKTTAMTEADRLIQKTGKKMHVFAPSADAARGVLVSEGFKDAETVARLLIDERLQEQLRDQVIWIDEAGLLGTRDMTAILNIADKQNARLVLGGDTRQHASVVRGDALRILNTVGGIRTAEITRIYRQRSEEYRAAVEDLSKGAVSEGFAKLNNIGAIKRVDPLKPNDELVDDYIKTVQKGKSALIVSPTHKQGNAVTDNVRKRLRSIGELGKKEVAVTKLNNLNMTDAQKSDLRNFQKDQLIFFNQNMPKIKRGSLWSVKDVSNNNVIIRSKEGNEQALPRDRAKDYEVFYKTEMPISKGDKVRITKNSFDQEDERLNNGTHLEVLSVYKSGKILLHNPKSKLKYTIDKNFGHIDHAYCTTSHSSQGKTVDEVFISQPASTFTATDAKQFYVSVSRGRDSATIYTDDSEALLEHASQVGDRKSALELVINYDEHLKHVQRMEQEKQQLIEQENNTNGIDQHLNRFKDYDPEL